MPFDMIKMRGVSYGIDCIKIFCVTVKVFVFRNFSDRTFKMDVINQIKT